MRRGALVLALVWGASCGDIGCLSSAPIVPQTPDNAAQIASCESTATTHNAIQLGDFVLTGGAAGLGAVGALVSDQQGKTDMAITATALGGAAVIASGLVAWTASNFANSQCPSVVGPLPVLPSKKP